MLKYGRKQEVRTQKPLKIGSEGKKQIDERARKKIDKTAIVLAALSGLFC